MEFGTTELDAAFNDNEKIETYDPEPGFFDTFKASVQNFTSVSLSSSEANYYKDERDTVKADWVKANPKDEALYNRITAVDKSLIEKLDSMYESGDIEQIKNWHTSTDSSMVNISGVGIGSDYLKFRELQSSMGLTNTTDIINGAKNKAKDDYYKSAEVLEKSDHMTAELLGSMWGALHDPVTIATLPLGAWKSGGTVLSNAGRATLEEMKIEAMAQSIIAPTVASYKQELEIKTTLAGEATNAAIAIGSAGLLRGAGSAAFDLSAKGIKALKLKDPELGGDYEQMVKSQATEDVTEHIDNLHKAEFDEAGIEEIKTPNAKGEELNKAEPLVEHNPEYVAKAKDAIKIPDTVYHGTDAVFAEFDIAHAGKTDEGFAGKGFYFTNSKEIASEYTTTGNIKEVSIDMKNPLIVKEYDEINKLVGVDTTRDLTGKQSEVIATKLQEEGYDGVIILDRDEFGNEVNEYVVFNKNQIKEQPISSAAKHDPLDFEVAVGVDEAGDTITKSYRTMTEEVDLEAQYIAKAKECFL